MKKKYREFRLEVGQYNTSAFDYDKPNKLNLHEEIHVIEKQAYDEATSWADRLAEEMDNYVYNFECIESCQCCLNNKGNISELEKTLSEYKKFKELK